MQESVETERLHVILSDCNDGGDLGLFSKLCETLFGEGDRRNRYGSLSDSKVCSRFDQYMKKKGFSKMKNAINHPQLSLYSSTCH